MRRLLAVLPMLSFAGLLSAQSNFPSPPTPTGNRFSADKALLGMTMFWEEQLSSTDTVACGSCHTFASGGCDPRTAGSRAPGADHVFGTADDTHGSPGVTEQSSAHVYAGSTAFGFAPQVTPRRTPSVVNAGYQPVLFYDGRVSDGIFRDPVTNAVVLTSNAQLENLILQPPLNPVEMGYPGRTWTEVAQKIAGVRPLALASALPSRLATFVGSRSYPALFQTAFGTPDVTPARIVMAIATYVRTLNSDQTPWDDHLAGNLVLTAEQASGLALFRAVPTGGVSCSTCHGDFDARVRQQGPIVGQMTTLGPTGPYTGSVPTRLFFHNLGIQSVGEDPGRQGVTNQAADAGKFRVATLRNVALGGPYYHNGSLATLLDVLAFYERGGDFHQNQAPGVVVRQFPTGGKEALVALLEMLTDPRVAQELEPFDRPQLGSENGRLPSSIGGGSQLASGDFARSFAPHVPRLGQPDFTLLVDGVEAGAPALLLIDTNYLSGGWNMGSVQFMLPMTPRMLLRVAGIAVPTQHGSNAVATSFPIPNQPALRGTGLWTQWLFTDSAGSYGLATSDALQLRLQ